MPFLAGRGLPLGAKYRLYSVCVCSIMLYGFCPVKEKNLSRLGRNDTKMVRCMYNIRPYRIFAEEHKNRLNLYSMRKIKDCNGLVILNEWKNKCKMSSLVMSNLLV